MKIRKEFKEAQKAFMYPENKTPKFSAYRSVNRSLERVYSELGTPLKTNDERYTRTAQLYILLRATLEKFPLPDNVDTMIDNFLKGDQGDRGTKFGKSSFQGSCGSAANLL